MIALRHKPLGYRLHISNNNPKCPLILPQPPLTFHLNITLNPPQRRHSPFLAVQQKRWPGPIQNPRTRGPQSREKWTFGRLQSTSLQLQTQNQVQTDRQGPRFHDYIIIILYWPTLLYKAIYSHAYITNIYII